MSDFTQKESRCELQFRSLGDIYHLWTPENHEIIFTCETDFRMGINIIGVAAKLFPDVHILTFEIMTNHLHIAAAAEKECLLSMFDTIKIMLSRWLKTIGRANPLKSFRASVRHLDTLGDIRNVIAYDNRNGFLVNPDYTPFTYPWGANRYYFSPDTCRLAQLQSSNIGLRARRQISHSRIADRIEGLCSFEGCALPLSFCDINSGESLFRDASHYFNMISKNIESNAAIAKEIGESIWYTDDELYSIVLNLCRKRYMVESPKLLEVERKIELARSLHFEYNAGAKQIRRMLVVDASILKAIGIT